MRSHLEESHRCPCLAKMFLKVQMFDIKKNNPGIIISTRSKLQPRFLHADVSFFSFSFFSLVLVMRPIYYVFKPAGPGKVGWAYCHTKESRLCQ